MSAITNKLLIDKKTALKEKNEAINAVITLLLARLSKANKESKSILTEDEEIIQISSELKQTRESLSEYMKAGREDLINRTKIQIDFIETFLPKQLSKEEITEEVKKTIFELGIENPSKKDMGLIMKAVNSKLKARADGKLISEIVRGFIN